MVSLGALGVFVAANAGNGAGAVVVRGADGYEVTVPPGQSTRVFVPGPVGDTVVVVEDGVARVAASDCRHQICVNMGSISAPGEMIVCVPNEVTVLVTGRRDEGPDAVTR